MGWLFFDRTLRAVMGLVVSVWVARYLGVELYGTLTWAFAFVSLFGALVTLGLDDVVIRDIVSDPSAKESILGTTFGMKMAGGVFVLILSFSLALLLRPGDSLALGMVALYGAARLFQPWNTIDLWFQSQVQSKYTVWAKTVAYLLTNLVKVGAILLKAPAIIFASTMMLESALTGIGLSRNYKSFGFRFRTWRFSLKRTVQLFSDSWPLMLSSIMVILYDKIDVLMLERMTSDAAVGIYMAAAKLIDTWAFIPVVITSSLFPSLIRSSQRDATEYKTRLQYFYDANACVAYLLIALTVPVAPLLIQVLYGAEFAASAPIFVIYAWSSIFAFMGAARGRQLINDGLLRFPLIATVLGVVVNVSCNLVLIPLYEGTGAAIATIIAHVTASYLSSLILWPRHRIWAMQTRALFAPLRYALRGLRWLAQGRG